MTWGGVAFGSEPHECTVPCGKAEEAEAKDG